MQFNRLIPELSVSDFKKSRDFYVLVLGFKIEYEREHFAFLSFQGSQIMIEQANDKWNTGELVRPFGRGINFQIEVDSIDPVLKRLASADHPLFEKSKENWYKQNDVLLGCKEFLVQDPDGYLLRFSEDIGQKDT